MLRLLFLQVHSTLPPPPPNPQLTGIAKAHIDSRGLPSMEQDCSIHASADAALSLGLLKRTLVITILMVITSIEIGSTYIYQGSSVLATLLCDYSAAAAIWQGQMQSV